MAYGSSATRSALAEISVRIDEELLRTLDAIASEKGKSRDELIAQILSDGARSWANESKRKSRGRLGRADEKLVEERLRALGYT